MSEKKEMNSEFVGYDYKEIVVTSARVSMYLDGYESFGWKNDDEFSNAVVTGKTMLHLRRDRKIINKMELTRLQRNFEANMAELDVLEKSKNSFPQIVALSIGIIGTAFMAGSVFAVTATPPIVWLCVLLAIPGILGWLLPYYVYKKLVKKRIKMIVPLMEEKYDEIYELCRKGSDLLK